MIKQDDNNSKSKISILDSNSMLIYVGAYGSGKSEVSVNSALQMESDNVILADIDIINPFYRSFDAKDILSSKGIKVIAPRFANTNVDAPSIPQELNTVFDRNDVRAVLDIGGEDMGARIVSNLKEKIILKDYELIMVINTKRPFTSDVKSIINILKEIEDASGILITGLVNNTNLLDQTIPEDIFESNKILKKVSDHTGIPFIFASGMDEDYPAEWGNILTDGVPFFRMKRTIFY